MSIGPYRLQITAGPSLSAASLVDLACEAVFATEDVDLGSPDVAFDVSGFPVEGGREVSVPLHISGDGSQVGRVMGDIARAISLPGRWLLIQRSADTDPVWFRLRPASPGALDASTAYVDREGGYWTWELDLTVDSTAVGERRLIPRYGSTETVPTVDNSGTARGVMIDPPGEAPCPLRVDVKPSMNMNGRRVMLSVFSVPWDSPQIWDGPRGAMPRLVYSDAGFEPSVHGSRSGSKDFLSGTDGISITMDTPWNRQWAVGSPGGTLEPGRYLVLVRLYREGGAGQLEVRMAQRWGLRNSWQQWRPWRPTDGGNRSSWLPVGYLQHPYGVDGEGMDPHEIMPPTLKFDARPTTTSTALTHLDQVAFVPVDLPRGSAEVASFNQFEEGVGAGDWLRYRFDSEFRRVSILDDFDRAHSSPAPLRTGGWPVAVPGMATGVSVFLDCSDAPVGVDTVAVTSEMTVSAAPRLLHLGQER